MKYAIQINPETGRIEHATFSKYVTPANADKYILVDIIPEGDIHEYRYGDGEYIHDPLAKEEVVATPSQLDLIEAQVTYTAMMTDTLLEV